MEYMSLLLKHVIVGKSVSEESKLEITLKRLTFWSTNLETKQKVPISMNPEQIGKIIVCHQLSTRLSVLIIYPTPETINAIQTELCLSSEQFKFSLNPRYSRIFMMPYNIGTTQLQDMVKKVFTIRVDVMTIEEASAFLKGYSEVLVEITERNDPSPRVVSTKAPEKSRMILRYPPNSRGCISISTNDYLVLTSGTYLNDAIIDVYLKYFYLVKISEDYQRRTHVFDSLFYKKLIAVEEGSADEVLTKEEQNCDEKVKLFEKDFIFVPINFNKHWFLAVICYPHLVGHVLHHDTREEIDPQVDKQSPIIQSCILIFDSLGRNHPNVLKTLRNHVNLRYSAEHNGNKVCDFNSIPGSHVNVPCQQNDFDCGIFLLQYLESFYMNPIQDFRTPIKGLENWFEQDVINRKRKDLVATIQNLVAQYEPENNAIICSVEKDGVQDMVYVD